MIGYVKEKALYKDFVSSWFGGIYVVSAVDPEAVKFVLKANGIEKVSGLDFSKRYKANFTESLVHVNGDVWRRQKMVVGPGFTDDAVMSYYSLMVEVTEKGMGILPVGEDYDVTDFFSRFTLDVLGKTIFNHDFDRLGGKNDKYYRAYKTVLGIATSSTGVALALCPWVEYLPLKAIKEFNESVDVMVQFFNEMIEQHKDKVEDCILARLIKSGHINATVDTTNDTVSLSRKELISNLWIFFLAGHDTTSIALAWALNCLREFPDMQEKIYQEILSTIGPDKIPSSEDLNKLTYLDCFIQEVLRLHPPVSSVMTRIATEDVKYKDKIIPKGSRVTIFFPIVHTNPYYWDEPYKFNPDRFTHENKKGRNHFMHIPFSAGLRQCIGTNFSLVEQRLFLVRCLQRFKVLDPVKTKPFPQEGIMSLGRMKPIFVKFERRN
jgi:cytochrome P450